MPRPFESQVIQGEPIRIGERTITPVVRLTRLLFLQAQKNSGGGGGFVRITPVAVIERVGDQENRIELPDTTGAALRSMFIGAISLWIVLWMMRIGVSLWLKNR